MAKTTPATRGITRKRIRLMPIASSAAISWPTCMLPNSVQMAVPDRQITMNAVRSGPSSRTNVSSMILARKAPAPTCGNVVPAWMMMMRPSINAIAPTTGSASTPVNRIWRVMTRKTSPRPRRAGEKSSRKARRPRTRTAAANSRPSSVVLPPNEGTDAPGVGLGGQEGLARRETQRDIDLDPFRRQCLAGFQALRDQRDLDHDVLMDLGEVLALFDHRIGFDADDLGADRAVHDRADFLEEVLETTPFLGH